MVSETPLTTEEPGFQGYRHGFEDRMNHVDLGTVQSTAVWRDATDDYKDGWSRGYERASNLPYLTLGDLREATKHLPNETPITLGGYDERGPEWLNVQIGDTPDVWPHEEKSSIILEAVDTYDSRQW